MELEYDYSVVVIGMSGSGKSAFLNALKNYFEKRTPQNFNIFFDSNSDIGVDNSIIKLEIVKSEYNNKRYLLIDTPGLCDTSGNTISKEENAKKILNSLKNLPFINAIIYVHNSTICKVTKEFREATILMLKFLVSDVRNITYSVFTFSEDKNFDEEDDVDQDIRKVKEILKFDTKPEYIVRVNNIFFGMAKEKIMKYLKPVMIKWQQFIEEKINYIVNLIEREKINTDQYELFGELNNKIKRKIMKCANNYYKKNEENINIRSDVYNLEQKKIALSKISEEQTIKNRELKRTPGSKNYCCYFCKKNCRKNISMLRELYNKLSSKCKKCGCRDASHVISDSKYCNEEIKSYKPVATDEVYINRNFHANVEDMHNLMDESFKTFSRIEKIIPEYSVKNILSDIKYIMIKEMQNENTKSPDFIHCIILTIEELEQLYEQNKQSN